MEDREQRLARIEAPDRLRFLLNELIDGSEQNRVEAARKLTFRVTQLEAELTEALDRLELSYPATWAGLKAHLDEHYPGDIFPDDDRNLGPNFVVAARRLIEERDRADAAVAALTKAEATIEAVRRAVDPMRPWLDADAAAAVGVADTTTGEMK